MRDARGGKIQLHIYIAYIFVGLITVYALVTGWYQYRQVSQILLHDAGDRIRSFAEQTSERVHALYAPALTFTEQLARQRVTRAESLAERIEDFDYFVTGLRLNPDLASTYVGYPDGDFFLVRPYRDGGILNERFEPPAGTAWIVQSIDHDGARVHRDYLFFDAKLKLLERRAVPEYRYDPRKRNWYQTAQAQEQTNIGAPSLFFTTREVGVTFSRSATSSGVVAAADLSLHSLQALIGRQRLTPSTRLLLLNQSDEVLSWHDETPELKVQADGSERLPTLEELLTASQRSLLAQFQPDGTGMLTFEQEEQVWQGMAVKVPVPHAPPMRLWATAPQAELVADAMAIRNRSTMMALAFLLVGVAAAYGLSRLISHALDALTEEASRIERFEFDNAVDVNSRISEISDLSRSMSSMKNTIRRFLQLSEALATEQNFQRLLHRLLDEFRTITSAQGGVIYLVDPQRGLKAAHADWQGKVDWEIDELRRMDQPATILFNETMTGTSHRRVLAAGEAHMLFSTLVPRQASFTLMTLPLRNRAGELLGAMALFVDESVQPLTSEHVAFTEALSGTAAVAMETQHLIEEQKLLMESIIQVIAGAIDAKSAYTGGHCQRVPALAKLIAKAACEAESGTFADFTLSENQWEELHIAAWLHDCGKVTTPEYIVDKATKLETLYDRIHEVRMRFEVLKRDAEIDYWRALAQGGDEAVLMEALIKRRREIDDDFAFVAECNQGGEFMTTERLDRLRSISHRSWLRTISDRLGLSHEELERKSTLPEQPLPCVEPLLADKPEHLFRRGIRDQISPDNPWEFRVEVPAYLYNRGELYNLSVQRGTLSEEERFKINEHMIQTIKMLDQLPFPRHLRHVPEIAGGHHEKMDGTGYPKRLRREQMSVLARMMAVADIFEALTAVDRPYKRGKTLSESVQIMTRMAREGHIDGDVFELFLREKVYLRYARDFLREEQIDSVDVEAALA